MLEIFAENMTSNPPITSPKPRFDFNAIQVQTTSSTPKQSRRGSENISSLISSPNLTGNFRPQISSAMPAIADDEDLENITMGDDDVMEDPKTTEEEKNPNKTGGRGGNGTEAKSSRFFMRIWSWMQSKYKLGIHRGPNCSSRNKVKLAEFHTRKVLNAKTEESTPIRSREKIALVRTKNSETKVHC